MKRRYDELSWPEIRGAAEQRRVIVIPVGAVEDHGLHLPLATDNIIVDRVCRAAVERGPEHALLFPAVQLGFTEHHSDFPGGINVEPEHLIGVLLDVVKSLGGHGFDRIMIVNGHGPNRPIVEIVARKSLSAAGALCAAVTYWNLIPDVLGEVRESVFPGGVHHACEMETSLMLYLQPDLVEMEKARKEIGFAGTRHFWLDQQKPSPFVCTDWFSSISESGVMGDPTVASSEKGARLFDAIVARLADAIVELKLRERKGRRDHHRE